MWHAACGMWHVAYNWHRFVAQFIVAIALHVASYISQWQPGGRQAGPRSEIIYCYAYAALHKQTQRVLNICTVQAIRRHDTADAPQNVLETIARFMKAQQEEWEGKPERDGDGDRDGGGGGGGRHLLHMNWLEQCGTHTWNCPQGRCRCPSPQVESSLSPSPSPSPSPFPSPTATLPHSVAVSVTHLPFLWLVWWLFEAFIEPEPKRPKIDSEKANQTKSKRAAPRRGKPNRKMQWETLPAN